MALLLVTRAITPDELAAYRNAPTTTKTKMRKSTRALLATFGNLEEDGDPYVLEVPEGKDSAGFCSNMKANLVRHVDEDTVDMKVHPTKPDIVLLFKIKPKPEDLNKAGNTKSGRGHSTTK
jgi:hypothetical protein